MFILFLEGKAHQTAWHIPPAPGHTLPCHGLAKALSRDMNLLQFFSYSKKARPHPEEMHSLLLPLVDQNSQFLVAECPSGTDTLCIEASNSNCSRAPDWAEQALPVTIQQHLGSH